MKDNAQSIKNAEAFTGRFTDGKYLLPSQTARTDAAGDRRGTAWFLPRSVFLILVLMMLISGFRPAEEQDSSNISYNDAIRFISDGPSLGVSKNTSGQLFLGNSIDSVAVKIGAPRAGLSLDEDPDIPLQNAPYEIVPNSLGWSPSVDLEAAYGTSYTFNVTVKANANYAFTSNTSATVNNAEAEVSLKDDGTLIVTYTFSPTLPIETKNKNIIYSPNGISIPVEGMFTFPSDYTGRVRYFVGVADGDTGQGHFDSDSNMLSVTQVGTFTVTVLADEDEHYSGAVATAVLTVNYAMTVTSAGYNGTYDGGAHSITVTVTDPDDAVIAYREKEDVDYTLTKNPQYTDAGNYTVYYQVTKPNYETVTGSQTVNIAKKSVTVTVKNKTITYGDVPANNGFETEGFVDGVDDNLLDDSAAVYDYDGYKQYGDTGTYAITLSGLTSDNYQVSKYNPGTLIVNTKAVAVVWDNTPLTFNGEKQAPKASVADGDLVNGDNCAVTVSGKQIDAGGPYTAAAVALSNSNYSLLAEQPTTTFTIAKANAKIMDDIRVSDSYAITSKTVNVSTNIPQMPTDAGALSYAVKQVSVEGAVNAAADIDADGKLTFSLKNGTDGDKITAVVTVSSKNYMESDVNLVLTLGPKKDAEVSFEEGNSLTVTYGDSLILHPAAANSGTNGGWTLSSSEESVATAANDGTVTILKAG